MRLEVEVEVKPRGVTTRGEESEYVENLGFCGEMKMGSTGADLGKVDWCQMRNDFLVVREMTSG